MEQLLALIEKLKNGTATDSDKKIILEALSSDGPELKAHLENQFEKDINNGTRIISEERSAEIFSKIQQLKSPLSALEQTSKPAFINISGSLRKWISAACIIGLIALGSYFFNGKKTDLGIATSVKKESRLKQVANLTEKALSTILPDGSTVSIEPRGAISYYQPFETKRDISLRGRANFKVAKDASRPFTVYANGLATTAVGTEFTVDASGNMVQVKLLEGKVLIRSVTKRYKLKDTYLMPGQFFSINQQTGIYVVNNFTLSDSNQTGKPVFKKTAKGKERNNERYVLTFSKTPLTEVFHKVGNRHNILIQYNKDDLNGLSFTGSFLSSDSLQTILALICSTNDLAFKQDKGVIVITKL